MTAITHPTVLAPAHPAPPQTAPAPIPLPGSFAANPGKPIPMPLSPVGDMRRPRIELNGDVLIHRLLVGGVALAGGLIGWAWAQGDIPGVAAVLAEAVVAHTLWRMLHPLPERPAYRLGALLGLDLRQIDAYLAVRRGGPRRR